MSRYVRFDHLPDMLLPALRRPLFAAEMRGTDVARLAFRYISKVTLPALQALASLPAEEAARQIAAIREDEQDDD